MPSPIKNRPPGARLMKEHKGTIESRALTAAALVHFVLPLVAYVRSFSTGTSDVTPHDCDYFNELASQNENTQHPT